MKYYRTDGVWGEDARVNMQWGCCYFTVWDDGTYDWAYPKDLSKDLREESVAAWRELQPIFQEIRAKRQFKDRLN